MASLGIVEATQEAIRIKQHDGLACSKTNGLELIASELEQSFDSNGLIGVEVPQVQTNRVLNLTNATDTDATNATDTNATNATNAKDAATHSLLTNAWRKTERASSYNHPQSTQSKGAQHSSDNPSEKPSQNNRRKYPPLIK